MPLTDCQRKRPYRHAEAGLADYGVISHPALEAWPQAATGRKAGQWPPGRALPEIDPGSLAHSGARGIPQTRAAYKTPPNKEGRWRSRTAVYWGSFPVGFHTRPQAEVAPFSDPVPAGPVFHCFRKTIPASLDCFCPSCLHPAFQLKALKGQIGPHPPPPPLA